MYVASSAANIPTTTTCLSLQEDGHRPRDTFMVLPSKEEYPDYYEVIQEPIDLTMIKERMETNNVSTKSKCVVLLNSQSLS